MLTNSKDYGIVRVGLGPLFFTKMIVTDPKRRTAYE